MKTAVLTLLLVTSLPTTVAAQIWVPVTGDETLQDLLGDKLLEGKLTDGVTAIARYYRDGSGELEAWGDSFPRTWSVTGENQVCVQADKQLSCVRIERNLQQPDTYRATDVETGEVAVFQVSEQILQVERETSTDKGGAVQPSAEELAAKLSNPTAPVMTIGNNFDYVSYQGDLPGAGDESAFRYVFQTTFPFKLAKGGSVFFRPALPVLFGDPVPNGQGSFSSEGTDLGDLGFDFSYGTTTPGGLLWGLGVAGTMPTATNDKLGKDLWGLGPELLLGVIGKWGVVGGIISHQWDVAGSGKGDIDLSSLSYFYAFPLGGGWQVAAGPTVSYDHARNSDDRWSVPLGIGLAKTSIIGGRPWKFQLQYWNYVEGADPFSAEHQVRLSINPVVSAPWNDGK